MYLTSRFPNCQDVIPRCSKAHPPTCLAQSLPITTSPGYVTAVFRSFTVVSVVIPQVPLVCGTRLRKQQTSYFTHDVCLNWRSRPHSCLSHTPILRPRHPLSLISYQTDIRSLIYVPRSGEKASHGSADVSLTYKSAFARTISNSKLYSGCAAIADSAHLTPYPPPVTFFRSSDSEVAPGSMFSSFQPTSPRR